ncbi:MAG TPA: hypothetical protein ENG34_00920 [Candidatus Aenigmarchaeota archaeon]|nr:hypothetical protein [Candidatus Aenigmarchaeota archaeon]
MKKNLTFWSVWILALLLLLFTTNEKSSFDLIILLSLYSLCGILMYSFESREEKVERLIERLEKKGGERKITSKISEIEARLRERSVEEEKRYREVVRKVLELENKLNQKSKLLGEAILKLKEKLESSG